MKKSAKGTGTIRKKTVTRSGKEYTYWEARITTGRDPGTGKQIQRSFTGKTQKEVREKMQAAAVAVNEGTYTAPQRMTVGQWLDVWASDYLGAVKPSTVRNYRDLIRLHIKPALGAVRLQDMHAHTVQNFINGIDRAPATVRLICGVLGTALEKAMELDYIRQNPVKQCTLPRKEQKEIHPLDDGELAALLAAAQGGELEYFITVALFTGMRMSELLGLTWDCVDYNSGTITVNKQLAPPAQRKTGEMFTTPKSHKPRTVAAAPSVLAALKAQRRRQIEHQLRAGPMWDNAHNLIFTNESGGLIPQRDLERRFRSVADSAGLEGMRFHDCRHTFAVNALRAGDDVKTVQGNLGHATAAFTLDRYGHFTETMQQASAAHMEGFIKNVLNL
ncbi:MAG: site-specific integrase [Oscillibacter sp.]|jgi:integrase|nr:site-specific integrase [Lawsonibacter sp.]MCI9610249.1 site-specific integrase [Oscillibacter sp.]